MVMTSSYAATQIDQQTDEQTPHSQLAAHDTKVLCLLLPPALSCCYYKAALSALRAAPK